MKLPVSLHTRLVLSHLLVSLVSITLVSAFAGNSIFSAARKDIEHNIEDLAFAASNALENPIQKLIEGNGDVAEVKQTLMILLVNHPRLQYTIFLPDGTPFVYSSDTAPPKADPAQTPELWDALNSDLGESDRIRADENGVETLYVAVRIRHDNQNYAVLRLGTAIQPALDPARRSLALLIIVALLVTLGVSLFGWLLASNLVSPIKLLTQTAERLAAGDLGARVNPAGPHELRRLAIAFNVMAGRLQDHMNELRAFVANASHELRTPLTVVKLRAEALRDGALNEPTVSEQFLTEIESEVDRLSRMVNDLLDLSRMEAGLASRARSLLNPGVIATEVYETFSIRAARANLTIELQLDPGLPSVSGNEDQLRRVLYNFVENAIKYTPSGGQVEMIVAAGSNGKTVRMLVRDTGPGIPAEHLAHIFERFYRVEATRPRYEISRGSGLGLAIAKTIVENHGGKIGVSSQLGKGSTFWAELPAQP